MLLAQIGCFVPARNASIPVRDRILTRVELFIISVLSSHKQIGTNDDMENNMSSFYVEMKVSYATTATSSFEASQETAHILNYVTERSLVIIDELGRG